MPAKMTPQQRRERDSQLSAAQMVKEQVRSRGYVGGEGYTFGNPGDESARARGKYYEEKSVLAPLMALLNVGTFELPDGRKLTINDLSPEERKLVNYLGEGVRSLPQQAGRDVSPVQAEINAVFAKSVAALTPKEKQLAEAMSPNLPPAQAHAIYAKNK